MRIEQARQLAFRQDMTEALVAAVKTRRVEMATSGMNSLGRLNDELFAQLERLSDVDVRDEASLKAEVERSRAVEGIAKTIIGNAETVLAATRMRAEYTSHASMPKMLEG